MIIQGRRVLYNNELQPAQISVTEEGFIQSISLSYDRSITAQEDVIDAGDLVVMPGIVDAHVHVNEPGRTDWEGYETATKAAAAGGITTIVDMPLNCSPVTTSVASLKEKIPHAERQSWVNVAFWGGIVPGMQPQIRPMINEGVRGFKCFLIHSGIDEFPHCTEKDLHLAYQQLEGTDSVFLFHAEVECNNSDAASSETLSDDDYKKFLDSRPQSMEVEAIKLIIRLCKQYRVRSHIVHLSAGDALPLIQEAQSSGAPLTVETCHHYLTLRSESVPSGATEYKCCPPIRNASNQELLWAALKDKTISMVVSDHSPCTADLKLKDKGDFMAAWGGIAGLQLGLSLFWTSCRERGFTISDLAELMSAQTAKHGGLDKRVGNLSPGMQADLVIWNPERQFKVTQDMIYHKNKLTPYLNMDLCGQVEKTIVAGKVAYQRGVGFSDSPPGHLLRDNMRRNV